MSLNCFANGCTKKVITICNCEELPVYCCSNHIGKHNKLLVKHKYNNLFVRLNQGQQSEILDKAIMALKHCKILKSNLITFSAKILETLTRSTKIALDTIKKAESIFLKFYSIVSTKDSVSTESYNKIKNLYLTEFVEFENCDDICQGIRNSLKENKFEFANTLESNEVVFSKGIDEGLFSIDLDTFKLKSLDFVVQIPNECSMVKVDLENYFFYGGKSAEISADALMINISEKHIKILKGSRPRARAATIYKDNKIYIFGGLCELEKMVSVCEFFSLDKNFWTKIANLPACSDVLTGAIIQNLIVVSGYELSCLYSYNDNNFESLFQLPKNECKLVCERWVDTKEKLYENEGGDISKWWMYNMSPEWEGEFLSVSTAFKRKQYFYFVSSSFKLMRIDTNAKKFEMIEYS